MARRLLRLTPKGLFCAAADVYVDPWRPVERAVVTHAHADHAVAGCGSYLCAREGRGVLRRRIGEAASITASSRPPRKSISCWWTSESPVKA